MAPTARPTLKGKEGRACLTEAMWFGGTTMLLVPWAQSGARAIAFNAPTDDCGRLHAIKHFEPTAVFSFCLFCRGRSRGLPHMEEPVCLMDMES